jgi:hypothetical protein
MKTFILALACIVCNLAFAQTPPATATTAASASAAPSSARQQHFQSAKTKRLDHIAARLAALQQLQTCVQAANNFAELHACHKPRK